VLLHTYFSMRMSNTSVETNSF